jgi:hypothetical protein
MKTKMKTKETSDFINCSDYMGQDYPKLTTNMFVKCFNGDFGKIAWTDGHRFKLGQNRFLHRANILSKMDIKYYRQLDAEEQKAYVWWNKLTYDKRTSLYFEYFGEKNYTQEYSEEITYIWESELQQESTAFEYRIMDDGSNYKNDIVFHSPNPVNQKQYKNFDYELFTSYINKFSNSDKGKIFRLMFNLCPDKFKHEEGSMDEFYLLICQAYNAGKQSMIGQHNGKEFKSSDAYYIERFGQNEIKFE